MTSEQTVPPEASAAEAPALATPAHPASRWRLMWGRWRVPVGALVLGLVVGGGIGAGAVAAWSDPMQSEEYQALERDLGSAQDEIATAESRASAASDRARVAANELATRGAELDQREQTAAAQEAAVAAREQAVTAVEQQIEVSSIGEGTWTVGRDVAPGTYRTAEPVVGRCYWGIYRSGSNGSDIIDNDGVTGGFPTVTLSEGQDFTNRGCGTFVKQ